MRRALLLLAAALPLATAACGGQDDTTTSSATAGSGGGGGGGGSGGAAPALDPALFDCTAAKPPERTNPTPPECATDTACSTRLVTGHRGVGAELSDKGILAPENSLAGLRAAIVIGLDFIETDPQLTKDGVLVNIHDPEVDRTTDGSGLVADMTLAEIQALHIDGTGFAGDFSCERVPTLEEVLLAARGKLHVLIDTSKTDQVAPLVLAVQATDTLDWAIFYTESLAKIDEALALEPALHIHGRISSEAELTETLDHLAAHPPIALEIYGSGDPATLIPAIHMANNRAFINAFATDFAAGLSGDASLYQEKWDLDPDIVETDRPDLVLQSLGRWPPPPQP